MYGKISTLKIRLCGFRHLILIFPPEKNLSGDISKMHAFVNYIPENLVVPDSYSDASGRSIHRALRYTEL